MTEIEISAPDKTRDSQEFEMVAGALCLDFANTVERRGGDDRRDSFGDFNDLVLWAKQAGIISHDVGHQLRIKADRDPESCSTFLLRAITLREAVYRIFAAEANGEICSEGDLEFLQEMYAEAIRYAHLQLNGLNYDWSWDNCLSNMPLDVVLWSVSESAVGLLRGENLGRVKQCHGAGAGPCRWLFLDTTKAGNRKWCTASGCGAKAKWQRQNARRRTRKG